MSPTDSTSKPPMNVLLPDAHGLMRWRPQYDGIDVKLGPRCVRLNTNNGNNAIRFDLSAAQARHLAQLLVARADQLDTAEVSA